MALNIFGCKGTYQYVDIELSMEFDRLEQIRACDIQYAVRTTSPQNCLGTLTYELTQCACNLKQILIFAFSNTILGGK